MAIKPCLFRQNIPLVKEVHFLFSRFFAEENGKKPFVKEVCFLLGAKIVEKNRKKNSGLDFVKEVYFLLGRNRGEICRTNTKSYGI